MFLATKIIRRISTSRHLEWYPKSGGVFVKFNIESYSLKTLFFVHQEVRFRHIVLGLNLKDQNVNLPLGVDMDSKVLQFLMDSTEPRAVQMTFGNRRRFLRNLACKKDVKKAIEAIEDQNSIYNHLKNYIRRSGQNPNSFNINYFLTHFYLRLAAQKYCKINNVLLTSSLTQKTKNDILNSIGDDYENNSPAQMKKLEDQVARINQNINSTKSKIEKIELAGEFKLLWYKYGAIFITAIHIISFGYMIFFVDWLGWDIIQPLTYTVGVLYTLLGIRFYRKFRIDRNSDSVRETLLKIMMKPAEKVSLKDLVSRQRIQERELKKIQGQMSIIQNRINFRTSLCTAFK